MGMVILTLKDFVFLRGFILYSWSGPTCYGVFIRVYYFFLKEGLIKFLLIGCFSCIDSFSAYQVCL